MSSLERIYKRFRARMMARMAARMVAGTLEASTPLHRSPWQKHMNTWWGRSGEGGMGEEWGRKVCSFVLWFI